MNHRSLTLVVHGESGAGKSWLADTAPAPRLVFDVEGGSRFTSSKKINWDPRNEPPEPDGSWDTAVVTTTDLDEIRRAYQWFAQGKHPFKSVVLDSLTEAQKRSVDKLAGTGQLTMQHYGVLLREGDALVRSFRDLTMHPTNPVDVVVFICGSREKGQEHPVLRPAMLGQMAEQIGYVVDVMMYIQMDVDAEGKLMTRAQFVQLDNIAAKDRTGRLGVRMDNPSIPKMLEAIYDGPKEA